jgi:hypothetical protein
MDAREFLNLQEAVAWAMWPIVQLLLGLLLAGSVFSGLYLFIARAARYLTRARGG